MQYPKVAIVIVNWNGKEDTIECLTSLKKINYPNYELVAVDNGYTDGSQKEMRNMLDVPLIENDRNLGFSGGVNVGIEHVLKGKADYVLLLNNDCIVDTNFLIESVKTAESGETIGIVGPMINF